MPSRAVTNFMKQQGFAGEPPDACDMHFEGLYFQPRIVFPAVIVAILLQLASVPVSAGLHFAALRRAVVEHAAAGPQSL